MVGEDPRKRIEKLWMSMPNRIIDTRGWHPKCQPPLPFFLSLTRVAGGGSAGARCVECGEPANRVIKGGWITT